MHQELKQPPVERSERSGIYLEELVEYAGHILTKAEVESMSSGSRVAFALETDESVQQTFGLPGDLTTALAKATNMDEATVVKGNEELRRHAQDERKWTEIKSSNKGMAYELTDAGREHLIQQLEKVKPS